ncbi:MAG: U32 family peptidase C-terminal domain-containing protein, partial [Planctomycetota bacterium]
GSITPDDYRLKESLSAANSIFVANVTEETTGGKTVLEVRNNIYAGDVLELLVPDGSISYIKMPTPLVTKDSRKTDKATNSQFILLDEPLPAYSILRRIKD